jgi:hypothetical protein
MALKVSVMNAPQTTIDDYRTTRGKLSLWTGVLGAPILWAIQLESIYSLSRFVCHRPWVEKLQHVGNAGLLLLAIGCCIHAFVDWRRLHDAESTGPGAEGRSRFMSVLGMMTSTLFILLMIAEWVPLFLIDPCVY